MNWTEERVAELRRLWAQGLSASQIAKRLGTDITRNAVIGKAHRLGLAGRPSPIQGEIKPRRVPANYKGPTCQWPIGDPSTNEFKFCGAPSEFGRPYCAEHCGVAYLRKERAA